MIALDTPRQARGGAHRLLFVVNWDWFFLSHRLPIARAALGAGYDVSVAAVDTGRGGEISAAGLHFLPLELDNGGMNPFHDAALAGRLLRLYRQQDPHIIHHVTIKPTIFGSLAAHLMPRAHVVNAISGLGSIFLGGRRARFVRPGVELLYRGVLRHPRSRTIFQNTDDRDTFVRRRLVEPRRTVLIRGSGVDCTVFSYAPEPAGPPLVLLPARLLGDKGVREFAAAAAAVRAVRPAVRFALAGAPDPANPSAISADELAAWQRAGTVECWGHRTDMPAVLRAAHVVVLPSYREGLPKVLLEAAATGRPVVTTDVPGCREVVRHGENGLLVPPRDHRALAAAILELVDDAALRRRQGEAGRRIARREFAVQRVVAEHLELYAALGGAHVA
jgi:glycosyltransferase involved in cell wall biosynthesis